MKKRTLSKIVAFTVCNVALSALSVASNFNESVSAEVDSVKQDATTNNYLLRLGYEKTSLSNKLEKNYSTQSVPNEYAPDADIIKKEITPVSILHIDLDSYYGERKTLDAYVNEALIQHKLLILENVTPDDLELIPSLPALVTGDVVLIKPMASGGTETIVYDTRELEKTSSVIASGVTKTSGGAPVNQEMDDIDVEEDSAQSDLPDSQMGSVVASLDKYPNILSAINDDIAGLLNLDNTQQLLSKTQLRGGATGGPNGYNCPLAGEQNKLCNWGKIAKKTYSVPDLVVVHGASYAMYRTRKETKVFISPYGSANPTVTVDTNDRKAYYLGKVENTINPYLTAGLSLESRYPKNQNNTNSLTTSSGVDFGVSASPSGPTASLSFSNSRSFRTNLSDWKAVTYTANGLTANWTFEDSKYPKLSDWVNNWGFKCKFKSISDISKYGLEYVTEAYWGSNNPKQGGYFRANISTKVSHREMKFTKNNLFYCKYVQKQWAYDIQNNDIALNLGWLKQY